MGEKFPGYFGLESDSAPASKTQTAPAYAMPPAQSCVCPLRFQTGETTQLCVGHRCAWWDWKKTQCAILSIARNLTGNAG